MLINVLLPAPFSPARTWTSPETTSKLTLESARVAPNDFETRVSSSKGGAATARASIVQSRSNFKKMLP